MTRHLAYFVTSELLRFRVTRVIDGRANTLQSVLSFDAVIEAGSDIIASEFRYLETTPVGAR